MTVGQEFYGYADALEGEISLLRDAEKYLYPVNMGATAIGTGINVPKGYPEKCAAHLAELTGKPITPASDMISATWDQQGFVVYSAALKSLAIKLSKISSDLILLTCRFRRKASSPSILSRFVPAKQPTRSQTVHSKCSSLELGSWSPAWARLAHRMTTDRGPTWYV
jgi:hypothetical protein